MNLKDLSEKEKKNYLIFLNWTQEENHSVLDHNKKVFELELEQCIGTFTVYSQNLMMAVNLSHTDNLPLLTKEQQLHFEEK